jgi:hypothetical protein
MRIVGNDYIFKLLNQEFFESVFRLRKRYFMKGEPSELGKGSRAYFVMKYEKGSRYLLLGEGVCAGGSVLYSSDEGYDFARRNGWDYVVDLEGLIEYEQPMAVEEVFTESTVMKIGQRRPYGIPLAYDEAKAVKEKLKSLGHSPRTT